MSSHTVEIVLDAQDKASAQIDKVEGHLSGLSSHLLDVTRNARMMHRETYGVSKFADALDTVAGTDFSGLISNITTVAEIADPLKSLGETIVQDAEGLATKIEGSLSSAWSKASDAPVLGTAIDKAGTLMSGKLGTAIKSAGVVGIVAGVAFAFDQANAELDSQVKAMGADQAKVYSGSFGQKVLSGIDQFLTANDLRGMFGPQFQNVLDDLDHMAVEGATTAGTNAGDAFSTTFATHASQDIVNLGPTGTQFGWTATVASHIASEFADQFQSDLGDKMDAASNKLADIIGGPLKSGMMVATTKAASAAAQAGAKALDDPIWGKSARGIDQDLAGALQGNKGLIKSAMDKVMYAINHPLALEHKEAKLQGAITKIEYLKGLNSDNQGIVDILNQQEQILKEQWFQITGAAYDAGVKTGSAFNRGYGNTVNKAGYKGNPFAEGTGHGGGPPGHRAAGGPTDAGETYVVGERGPEVLHMGRNNGYVSPNASQPPIHVVSADELAKILDRSQGRRLALAPGGAYNRS